MKDCPCGTPSSYTDCCARFIRGTAHPETAEELMRSRYSAYVMKHWDYLIKTLCARDRKHESLSNMDQGIVWTGLEVTGTKDGGLEDPTGEVSFVATYEADGVQKTHHERAQFVREQNRWVYSEKQSDVRIPEDEEVATVETFVRDQPKVGRNDPCPCGSKKKYKKCCGK